MVLGIYFAVKLCNISFFKPRAKLERVDKENKPLINQSSRAQFYFFLGMVLFVVFLLWVFNLAFANGNISTQNKQSLLALALILGFSFGFIIARGQICFTSCFRDLFLFGRDNAIKGALIGMIIACLIAFAFILQGHTSKVIELSPAVAVGAFLFGFGIVFVGGCDVVGLIVPVRVKVIL